MRPFVCPLTSLPAAGCFPVFFSLYNGDLPAAA